MTLGLSPERIREILVDIGGIQPGRIVYSQKLVLAIETIIIENNAKLLEHILEETDRRTATEIARSFRRHGLRA